MPKRDVKNHLVNNVNNMVLLCILSVIKVSLMLDVVSVNLTALKVSEMMVSSALSLLLMEEVLVILGNSVIV